MSKRIYFDRAKKFAVDNKIYGVPIAVVMILLLVSLGSIEITGYSGDSICAGTETDPCYAYINFTVNEDIFVYPSDNWSSTAFYTDIQPKSVQMFRSWGTSWREIKLNETCTGTWCGAPDNKGVAYSFAFRDGKDYQIRYEVLKFNPEDDVKWGFDSVDPIFFGTDNLKDYDLETNTVTITDKLDEIEFQASRTTSNPHYVISSKSTDKKDWHYIACYNVENYSNDYEGIDTGMEFFDRKNNMAPISKDYEWRVKQSIPYEIAVYGEPICKERPLVGSINGSMEKYDCQDNLLYYESKEKYEYVAFDDIKELEKDTEMCLFTYVASGEKGEYVPEFGDVKVEEDASWEESWSVGLISYWKLNNSMTDSVGNNDLTDTSTTNVTGIIGDARNVADGQYMSKASFDGLVLGASDRTICMWIYPTDCSGSPYFFGYGTTATSGSFDLYCTSASKIDLAIGGIGDVLSVNSVNTNTWWFICAVQDSGTQILYINATLEDTDTFTIDTTNSSFYIGSFARAPAEEWRGRVDEVFYANRSFSLQEISDIYDNGVGSTWSPPAAPTFTMTGSVLDDNKVLLPDATIILIDQADNSTVSTTTSNATGGWSFEGLSNGTYFITGLDESNSSLSGDAKAHVVI